MIFNISNQRYLKFLKKFNFGLPDTLNNILVLKLKKRNNIKGTLVIRWIIRYLGLLSFKIFLSSQKHLKKIIIKEILLLKKPYFGNLWKILSLKFKNFTEFSFSSSSHSPTAFIIVELNFFEYFHPNSESHWNSKFPLAFLNPLNN